MFFGGDDVVLFVRIHVLPPTFVPHWLRLALKSILTVSVLTALTYSVEGDTLVASLQQAQWTWVVVAVFLIPLNLALDGWVWKQLLDPVLDRVPLRALFGGLLSGIALGFWTPARAGEYAGRAFSLPEGDRWSISLTVFAQRMVDMAVGVSLGLLALTWCFWTSVLPVSGPWLAAGTIGLGTAVVLAVFIGAPVRVHRLARWLVPNHASVTDRTALFRRLSLRQGMAVLGGSTARYVVFTGQFACLGLAFAPSAPWHMLALGASLTFYAKYLIPSLTLLDLGIREGGAAFFFQQLGLGAAAGLNAALLLFALNILVPAALGLPFVARLRLSGEREETVKDRSLASVLRS